MVQSQSEGRPDSTESANLSRPRPADAVVASPSAAAGPEAVSPAVSSLPVPGSPQLAPLEPTRPIDAPATIPLDAVPTRSRRVKRFAVLGALTVVGVAASLSLVTPGRAPITVVDAGAEAPVAVIPASDLNGSAGLPSNDHPAPVPVAITNAEGATPAAPVAAPKPRVTHNTNQTVTTSRSARDAAMAAPQPDPRAASAESYVRSRAAELREYDQRWKRLTAPRP